MNNNFFRYTALFSPSVLKEELTHKQKKVVDGWVDQVGTDENAVPFEVHNKMFADHNNGDEDAHRIIIPFKGKVTSEHGEFNHSIAKHIHDNGGWAIHDYVQGIATRKLVTKKGFVKPEFKSIGAILQETNGSEKIGKFQHNGETIEKPLLKGFNEDPVRQNKNNSDLQLVISRHPHDVAGMSTNRGWRSCMTMPGENDSGGCNVHYLKDDLKHKTMVAYLTRKGDDDVERPLARVAIKRFTNNNGHDIWRPEGKIYGTAPDAMVSTVHKLTASYYPMHDNSEYFKHHDLYNDSHRTLDKNEDNVYNSNRSPVDDYNPKEVFSSKINEFNQLHTDNDEPALDYIDDDGDHSRIWMNNGTVHRENGPAFTSHSIIHGKELPSIEYHYLYGNRHDSKDGKPASVTHSYDDDGNMESFSHHYYRFGKLHNGVMSGFSKINVNRNNMSVSKHYYGQSHTDDDTPSHFEISFHKNGNIEHTIKRWHHYSDLQKQDDSHYNSDGKLIYKVDRNGDDSHSWGKAGSRGNDSATEGVIKKSIPHNGETITKITTYNDDAPNHNPSEDKIFRVQYTNIHNKYTQAPNDEPSLYQKSSTHNMKAWYDTNGNEHRKNGFSKIEFHTRSDHTEEKPSYNSFYLSRREHGNLPKFENLNHGDMLYHHKSMYSNHAEHMWADKSNPSHNVYVSDIYEADKYDPHHIPENKKVFQRSYRKDQYTLTDGPNGEPAWANKRSASFSFASADKAGKYPKEVEYRKDNSPDMDISNIKKNMYDYEIKGVKTDTPDVDFNFIPSYNKKAAEIHQYHGDQRLALHSFHENGDLEYSTVMPKNEKYRDEQVEYNDEDGFSHHSSRWENKVPKEEQEKRIDEILAEHGHTRESLANLKISHYTDKIHLPDKWSDLKVNW